MFSTRDLMVGLPAAGLGAQCPWNSCGWTGCLGCTGHPTVICGGASVCGGCTLNITCGPCTGGYTNCHPAVSDLSRQGCAGSGPHELRVLRGELERALQEVEAHEQALDEQLRPKTVEQVDELQRQLEGALEDLRRRRAELESDGGA
jgi:hypothetical protein